MNRIERIISLLAEIDPERAQLVERLVQEEKKDMKKVRLWSRGSIIMVPLPKEIVEVFDFQKKSKVGVLDFFYALN